MAIPEWRELLSDISAINTENGSPTTCLADLTVGTTFFVYGIVLQFRPPKKTGGSDYMVYVKLTDPSQGSTTDTLSINLFDRLPSRLPPSLEMGDVLKCHIKVLENRGKPQGLSVKHCEATVWTESELLPPERKIAKHLHEWWTRVNSSTAFVPVVPGSRPTLQISQIEAVNVFCDMYAQIIYAYPAQDRRLTLLITDFTQNACPLISEEAVKCLPFPLPSNAVLSCTLWDENVEEALYLPLGTYVHLRNSRIKSGGYNFEAALHGDRQYNGKTHVRALILGDPVDDPVIAEIQTRERILRAKHEAEMAANMPHPANMRHPANMPHQGAPQQTFERETVPANCRSGPHFTPLSSVSSASTQNSLHCRVKVIDHTPCDIRDFCRATCNSCLLRDLPLDPPCVECTKSAKYTYQFSLLIADETGCIPVILSSKTAEDIIGIPPTDMRRSPNALKQLKSKLGALWDVNGAPTDGPLVKRAKQFDCLIRAVPTRRLPCYRFKMLMTS